MTDEALLELCPLAALGALDEADRLAFVAQSADRPAVLQDLRAFERLVGLLGTVTAPVPLRPELRNRVLAAAGVASSPLAAQRAATGSTPKRPTPLPRTATGIATWRTTWLPIAAVLVCALSAFVWRTERNEARRLTARAEAEVQNLGVQNRDLRQTLDATKRKLDEAAAFRALVAHPGSRVAGLAGLPAAPAARGRVVWNAERREAVLLASGLPQAPAGKAYEAWVIAGGAPVPAGVFSANEEGGAVHALPRLDDVARAKTFAVTLEPEAGTPAPTGPMVLAGPAI